MPHPRTKSRARARMISSRRLRLLEPTPLTGLRRRAAEEQPSSFHETPPECLIRARTAIFISTVTTRGWKLTNSGQGARAAGPDLKGSKRWRSRRPRFDGPSVPRRRRARLSRQPRTMRALARGNAH
jgi:hypothetical protein